MIIRSVFSLMAAFCLSACSTTAVSDKAQVTLSPEMKDMVERTSRAITAYQNSDKETWEKLVCRSPLNESLEDVQRAVGKLEDARIVSINDVASAGNISSQEWRVVIVNGSSEHYRIPPSYRIALKFSEYLDIPKGCLKLWR